MEEILVNNRFSPVLGKLPSGEQIVNYEKYRNQHILIVVPKGEFDYKVEHNQEVLFHFYLANLYERTHKLEKYSKKLKSISVEFKWGEEGYQILTIQIQCNQFNLPQIKNELFNLALKFPENESFSEQMKYVLNSNFTGLCKITGISGSCPIDADYTLKIQFVDGFFAEWVEKIKEVYPFF